MSDQAPLTTPRFIISIAEARKLLGEDGRSFSDEEIADLINEFSAIAQLYIEEQPK